VIDGELIEVMKMNVRFGNASDFTRCKSLDSALTKSRFSSAIKEKEIVLITHGSAIIGYLRIEHIWLKIPYISWIFVKEEFRNLGGGQVLLTFLATHLKKKSHKFILSSYQANAPTSKRWHARMGFKKCGKIHSINEDGSAEVFCKLKI
jgi:ribosomal protein S18 acetylase RimI-like enzyme